MGGIIKIFLKTIIDFATVSSIEIEKNVHSNSIISSIDLDILNPWFYYDLQ